MNPKPKNKPALKVELEQTLFQEVRSRSELEALLARNFPDSGPEAALARYWALLGAFWGLFAFFLEFRVP